MNHLELFSGIGGFSLAASWVWKEEHNIVSFVEIDPYCQKVLKKHWPDVPIISDIRDVTHERILEITTSQRSRGKSGNTLYKRRSSGESGGKSLSETTGRKNGSTVSNNQPTDSNGRTERGEGSNPTIDLLTGGPPCQRTSTLAAITGSRTGETLWPEMARVVEEITPAWVFVEQPAGNKKWETQVKMDLESFGYFTTRLKRQAKFCGAPHARKRVFIIANTDSERLNKIARLRETPKIIENSWPTPPRGAWRSARTGNCGVDDGVSDWSHRLKSLGNAIVPQVVVPIMQAIKNIEG